MSFARDTHGRQGIGVTQPQSGTDYPLVLPSVDVRYLLADFWLSFDQPSDYYDGAAFRLPFRIYWMSGFGTVPPDFPIPSQDSQGSWSSICEGASGSLSGGVSIAALDCMPLPKHDHDIIVVDADDRIVFDSTQPLITHEARDWGDRLKIVVWRHPTDQFVSLVYHTAWSPNDFPEPREYSSYFFPSAAVLDERAVERLPKRVRSLTVVLDNLRKTPVNFAAGYNMNLVAEETSEPTGKRRTTRVTFNASPGAGLGVFPDCTPETLNITGVNGVNPTKNGDFFLSATDCYWIRQPTRVVAVERRLTFPEIGLSPGNIPTPGLPDVLAGTTKDAAGWPNDDDPRYAHLQFGSDCDPCCDCPDYVAIAQYMNKTRDVYQRVGKKLEGTRDLYHMNRERWLASLDCMNRRPLRLRLLPQLCPFLDVAVQLCNQIGECLVDVELKVVFTTSPENGVGAVVPGFTFITGARTRPGGTAAVTDRYQMGGDWPEYTAFFDTVQPGQSVFARFRLKFANCGLDGTTPYAVTGVLTATEKGEPLQVSDGALPPTLVAATAAETRTLDCPGRDNTVNYLACACEK